MRPEDQFPKDEIQSEAKPAVVIGDGTTRSHGEIKREAAKLLREKFAALTEALQDTVCDLVNFTMLKKVINRPSAAVTKGNSVIPLVSKDKDKGRS